VSTRERAPSLRDEQKRFTRQRLIDAAKEVFADVGYAAATIEDITRAAGASRATFYLHFKSKATIVNELFLQVLLPESNEIYERLHQLTAPTRDDVRAFVADTFAYWDRIPTVPAAVAPTRRGWAALHDLLGPRRFPRR